MPLDGSWYHATQDVISRSQGRSAVGLVVRVEHVHVHQGGQAIVGNVKAGDTRAETKPAPPLAIGQEQSGITLDDLIGKQPELVGREGV
jgi:hypothetical protein